MKITQATLAQLDMEALRSQVQDSEWFYAPAGKEHYRLLAYLSTQFNGRDLIDIGTHHGDSAHALAYNPTNRVVSFDVEVRLPAHRRRRDNIQYKLSDLWDAETREAWKAKLLGSAVILIDVDPHEGARELELVQWLRRSDYDGIIVLDDIWHFKPMRDRLWSQIEASYKIDATRLGHWSGTGLVCFGPAKSEIEVEGQADTSNWTLVTGYFDLTGMPDATPEIKARPPSHYLDHHAQGTLGLDQNLIVYCDAERVDQIWRIRPAHLHDRTRVVPMSFEDFPLTKYRDQILTNRGGVCRSDPRNTASYYLFCVARLAMLQRAMADNPFGSTHFAWINICLERMGSSNLAHLHEALAVQRDGFSTAFIDYVPRPIVDDLPAYFGEDCRGRTSFCSGFYTGRADFMLETCQRMEQAFKTCVDQGYGHADEQLMAIVYFEKPELFDWYLGDYREMVTNYARVYENHQSPLRNLIANSFRCNDWAVCRQACAQLLASHASGSCKLSSEELASLRSYQAVLDLTLPSPHEAARAHLPADRPTCR